MEAEAEACFQKAIEIARRQNAKSLELRATVSLTHLWQRQGKPAAARKKPATRKKTAKQSKSRTATKKRSTVTKSQRPSLPTPPEETTPMLPFESQADLPSDPIGNA